MYIEAIKTEKYSLSQLRNIQRLLKEAIRLTEILLVKEGEHLGSEFTGG